MANEFKIEVPIKIKSDKGGKKIGAEIAEQIKKTMGSIGIGKKIGGIGAVEAGGIGAGIKGLKFGATLGLILAALELSLIHI